MQLLVDDGMYVYQGEIQMSGGDSVYQWSYEEPSLTSRYDQIVLISECLHQRFYEKLLTPKYVNSFILVSLTNRSHQVNIRRVISPCFALVLCDETG